MVVSACPPKFIFAPLTNRLPVTVSRNGPTPMLLGLTALNTGVGFTSVIVADAFLLGSATLVAVTVTVLGVGTIPGASRCRKSRQGLCNRLWRFRCPELLTVQVTAVLMTGNCSGEILR